MTPTKGGNSHESQPPTTCLKLLEDTSKSMELAELRDEGTHIALERQERLVPPNRQEKLSLKMRERRFQRAKRSLHFRGRGALMRCEGRLLARVLDIRDLARDAMSSQDFGELRA